MNNTGRNRGQNTFEYILVLTAALMIVALTAYFLMNGVFAPQTKTLGEQSDQIKDYKKQLQQQTGLTQPGATTTPTGAPSQTPTNTPTFTPTTMP